MKKLWKFILLANAIIFSLTFIGGLFFNKSQIMNAKFLPLLIYTIVFMFFWIFIYKLFIKSNKEISKKKETIIFITISIIIILIECLYGYFLLSNGELWDMYVVLRAARDIASGNPLHYDDHIYFQLSITNRFITIFLSYIYKISYFFNITNKHFPHLFINITSIFISFVCLYIIIRKLYGNKLAIFTYASCLLLTPILIAAPITYTDTLSMPYIMLSVILYLNFKSCDIKFRKFIYIILLCIVMFVGCQFKMTVIFIGIGIFIDIIVNKELKKNLIYIFYFIILIITITQLYSLFLNKKNFFDADLKSKQYYMPYELYILFGADEIQVNEQQVWYGTWNQKDILHVLTGDENYSDEWNNYGTVKMYLYDKFQSSYKQKQILAREKIIETLDSYGIFGTIKHYYFKSIFIFADGTYYIPKKIALSPVNRDNILLEFFGSNGRYFKIYFYIAQGIHMSMLLFSIISCYINYKNNNNKTIIFVTSLLCLFLFLLIWEARSRYILNYSLFFVILAIDFFNNIKNKTIKDLVKYKNT